MNPDTPEPEPTSATLDVDAAASQMAGELFPASEPAADEPPEDVPEPPPAEQPPSEPPTQQARPVPKTWPKEMHEHWAKVDPRVQEYWNTREEQMHQGLSQYKEHATYGKAIAEAFAPYKALIASQGLDEPKVAQILLNAHYKLSTAPEAERAAYFADLAKNYGVDLTKVSTPPAAVDPQLKALHDKLASLESQVRTREQAALTQAQTQIRAEVDKFAADPAHPYFEELADDIAAMIQMGADLPTAYDKAMWANPATRAKEQARLTAEHEKKLKENARLDALKSRPAASANVRSRDTNRTPTEPMGTMDDTMKKTLADIRSRVSP